MFDYLGIGIIINISNNGFISLSLFTFGLMIIAIGGYTFRKFKTTVNPVYPDKASHLVASGIYSISRNPMYVGYLCWLLAATIFFENILNILLLPIFIILVNRLYIQPEEQALEKIFKDKFVLYKSRVRRWL